MGVYSGAGNTFHGFRGQNGNFVTDDFDPACSFSCGTEANAINSSGEIVGDVTDEAGNTHGYYEINGSFHLIDYPGAFLTLAEGVNDSGLVVGFYVDSSNVSHGFTLASGQTSPTSFDCSGGTNTVLYGVNNNGDMVGTCSSGAFKITSAQGTTAVTFTGASVVRPIGINNLGDISGYYLDANSRRHGFLISAGNAATIDPPASVGTQADKLNDQDEIVGDYSDSQNVDHGFLAEGPELLDPVPDLMSGPAIANQTLPKVGSGGRVVKGVGADGVTEVVVRIPAQNAGDQFQLKLLNDQNTQSNPPNPNWDGALGTPGDTTFSQNQLTVSAITVTNSSGQQNAFAFAVYRAPIDFVRQNSDDSYQSGMCNGVGKTDDNLACRSVSIQIQNLQTNTTSSFPVIILRPPVVLIHGLWDDKSAWNNFSPLITDPPLMVDSRFYVGRVSYDNLIGPSIVSSDPSYSGIVFAATGASVQLKAKANSLGFAFNAPNVLAQTDGWIENFKQGNGPMGIPVAAVQADIVAHSMGGDIARELVLQPTFLGDATFGQGSIHKLITIDTPHLGSPLASLLLSSREDGGCLEHLLALRGKFVFNTALLANTGLVSGAMSDLQPSSPALQNIANQSQHPLPTALIAGVYTNFQSLDVIGGNAFLIRLVCSTTDPLADDLTSSNYPLIFSGLANDAIVSEPSQLNGNSAVTGAGVFEFTGVVHSFGTEKLGFSGPSVLDAGPGVATTVILLLNTPINAPGHFNPISP